MNEIIIAMTVMGAIAIFLAIALIWSSKKFYVAENPLIEEVAAMLPQANCGACGYPGCAGFAKVLVETRDPKMICPVASREKLKEIGRIAGIEIDEKKPMIAVLCCNGTHDNAKVVSEYIGVRTCEAANNLYTGDKECQYSCIGYGDCVKTCLFGAIKTENGIAVFDHEKCTGCGMCARACPRKTIKLIQKRPSRIHVACSSHDKGAVVRKICSRGCIACGKCARVCPKEAIILEPGSNLARIDDEKCILCGKCAVECDVMKSIIAGGKIEKAIEMMKKKKDDEKAEKQKAAEVQAANGGDRQ